MTPGAAADPFGVELPPAALYVGPTLQQRIDLIEHLLEFGRQIVVLSGPPGSGKSTLLDAIARAAAERWSCVRIAGGPALQARTLLAQIADALDLDLPADGELETLQTMLRLRCSVLARAGKLAVLLVDDADALPPDAIAALADLAHGPDEAGEARVLMTASPDHAGLLAGVQRDRPPPGMVHVVEIPPLSETQVEEFIAQRLAAVGAALEGVFSGADLQRIAIAAAGNPGRVVALARQHYAGLRSATRRAEAVEPTHRRRPVWRMPRLGARGLRALFLLPPALAVAAWWWLRDAAVRTPPAATVALELPKPEPPAAVSPVERAPTDAKTPPRDAQSAPDDARELVEIVPPDEPVPTPAADAPTFSVPPAAAPTATIRERSSGDAPEAAGPATSSPPPTPSPPATPSRPRTPPPAPARSAATTTPAPPERRAPPSAPRGGFNAEWLLKQPSAAYTLQLAGVRDRSSAERFIARHGLQAHATILTTRRDGRPWYLLVHGYYPTRRAALAAAERLSPTVRKEVQPWARSIGEVAKLPR